MLRWISVVPAPIVVIREYSIVCCHRASSRRAGAPRAASPGAPCSATAVSAISWASTLQRSFPSATSTVGSPPRRTASRARRASSVVPSTPTCRRARRSRTTASPPAPRSRATATRSSSWRRSWIPSVVVPMRSWVSVRIAVSQPRFSSPTRFSRGTATSVRKISLKPASPVISRIGRTSTPGARMSITSALIPSWLARVRVGAHQREAQRGEVAVRRPDLVAGDEVAVRRARRLGAERREVAAGVRLAEALAPDVLAAEHPRAAIASSAPRSRRPAASGRCSRSRSR